MCIDGILSLNKREKIQFSLVFFFRFVYISAFATRMILTVIVTKPSPKF